MIAAASAKSACVVHAILPSAGYARSRRRQGCRRARAPTTSGLKEAFSVAILDRYFAHRKLMVDATLRDGTRTPIRRLHAYFNVIIARLDEAGWRCGRMIGNMSLEAAEHGQALRGHFQNLFERLSKPFADDIRAAHPTGKVRNHANAEELDDVTLSARHGVKLRRTVERSPEPLIRFRNVFLAVLLAGPWLPRSIAEANPHGHRRTFTRSRHRQRRAGRSADNRRRARRDRRGMVRRRRVDRFSALMLACVIEAALVARRSSRLGDGD